MRPLYDILATMYKKTSTTKYIAKFWVKLFADFFAKIVQMVVSAKDYALSVITPLFFPTRCISCGLFGMSLCSECAKHMTYAKTPEIPHSIAVFYYEHPIIKKAIHQLKFHGKSELAQAVTQAALPYITRYIAETLQAMNDAQYDTGQDMSNKKTASTHIVLVPSPLSKQRLAERGFNQSLILAQWISTNFSITQNSTSASAENYTAPILIDTAILSKERNTDKQSVMTSKQHRYKNIFHAMHAQHLSPKYDTQHTLFIIIDDVITTGATSTEAMRALQEAGALYIHTIALAHGKSL